MSGGNALSFGHDARSNVARNSGADSGFRIYGECDMQCVDRYGIEKWRKRQHNVVVSVGLGNILNVHFDALAASASWFIGLLDSGAVVTNAADTMGTGNHSNWTEFQNYSETTRPEWAPSAAAGSPPITMTNAATRDFSITGTVGQTIVGMFLVDNNVVGGETGLLWATAAWSGGDQTVAGSDTLRVTYTITAA